MPQNFHKGGDDDGENNWRLVKNEIPRIAPWLPALRGDQGIASRHSKRTTLIPALSRDPKDEINCSFNVAPAEKLGAGVWVEGVLPAFDARGVETLVWTCGRESNCLAGSTGRVGDVNVVELEVGARD